MKKLLLTLFILFPMMLSAQKLVPVQHKNCKWGYKQSAYAEEFVIGPKFEKVHEFANHYAFVCKKGLWGVIGKDGKFVLAPQYTYASEPCGGLTIVGSNGKFGLAAGANEKTAVCYDRIEYLEEVDCFRVYSNGKQGIINGWCKLICDVKYDQVEITAYRMILVKLNDKYGLTNIQNGQTIPTSYDEIEPYAYETFLVKANGKYGLLNKQGQAITKIAFDNIEKYHHDTFLVKANGKCGLLNKQGVQIIPVNITEIGWSAFEDCTSLINVKIGNSVTTIGVSAFENCYNIKSITIPNSVAEIHGSAFSGCTRLASVSIAHGVTDIADKAFSCCKSLTNISLPKSVEYIGSDAFYGCTALKTVYCNPTVPPTLEGGAFDYENGPICCTIFVPAASRTMYIYADSWQDYKRFIRAR